MADIYDFNYETEIAAIIARKAAKKSLADDLSVPIAKEKYQKTFSEILQKRALNFLKNLEKKIEELSNRDIANLLLALLSSGLSIESEEELEYWVAKLEAQALNRLAEYLEFFSITYAKDANSKKKFTKNVRDFSSKDIDGLGQLLQAVKITHKNKEPIKKDSSEYKKWLEKEKKIKEAEIVIKKDLEAKRKEEQQKSNPRPQQKNTNEDRGEIDTLGIVKSKMTSAGVEANGEYWNEVISHHDGSLDKMSFAQNWSADFSRIENENNSSPKEAERINELRGISKETENNKASEQSSQNNSQNNSNMNTAAMSSGNQGR